MITTNTMVRREQLYNLSINAKTDIGLRNYHGQNLTKK